jgi:hypothetical protein
MFYAKHGVPRGKSFSSFLGFFCFLAGLGSLKIVIPGGSGVMTKKNWQG